MSTVFLPATALYTATVVLPQQRRGVAVSRLLLLNRAEDLDSLRPVLLFEVADSLPVAVGEFGFTHVRSRIGDHATRVWVVRVELGEFLCGGQDVCPASGLVQCGHFVDECAESLG